MYHISNGPLRVSIAAKGAEIQSIFHSTYQLEYMWNGDPVFWGKKSPVLFPIVGGLKNNSYQYNGNTYFLGRHGFAREKLFTVTAQSPNSIQFTIEPDAETEKVYPFEFRFSVLYTLDEQKLHIKYLVENAGETAMYFSVGAHPAFAVPLIPGTNYTDYYLAFNKKETTGKWPLSADGLVETLSIVVLDNSNVLPLTKELFHGDALVFKHLHSSSISLLSDKTTHGVKVHFSGFPFMGIWSAKNADFVCIEPWCGIADSVDTNSELTQKEGIQHLDAGQEFERSWSIEVF